MEAEYLLQRLVKPELLKSDEQAVWKKFTADHPYCTIAHWLCYANEVFHDEGELAKFSFRKTDPIRFAEWIHQVDRLKSAREVNELNAGATNAEPSVQSATRPDDIHPVTPVIEPEPAPVELAASPESVFSAEVFTEHVGSEVAGNQEEAEPDPVMPSQPVGATFMQEHDIDVLDMIRDLPNSSPFDTRMTDVANEIIPSQADFPDSGVSLPDDEQPAEDEESDEDKSLMVMMSFTDWLKHFKRKNESEREEARAQKALKAAWQKEKLARAADEELEEIPEPIFKQAMESISMESSLISESLAEILARQGKKEKAIAMYKKLSLRNPEKSTYFADRINELSSIID